MSSEERSQLNWLYDVLLSGRRLCILFVRHVLHPVGIVAIQCLVHCDMNHPTIGRCAMPVLFAGSNPYAVARSNEAGRISPKLDAANT